ncbi:MAG: sigma-E factor negative regulatory protein [Porticoccaceae bacterium]
MSDSKQRLAESVSALVDGETSEIEMHQILREAGIEQAQQTSNQQSVRGKWQRYHMISASMAGAPVDRLDLSASISAAIDQETSHRRNPLIDMAGSAGRFAIAASVAMVAILGVQQLNSPDPASADALQFAEMDIDAGQQNNGPALQFPAGYQPSAQARTVSAGGQINSSQRPVSVVQVRPVKPPNFSEQQLRLYMDDIMLKHSNNAALSSGQGMLPFARVTKSESAISQE